jgi:hypothetical protein
MLAHLTGQPLRLRQACSTLPESLEQVIARSIAHEAGERYHSMQEFGEALEAVSGER